MVLMSIAFIVVLQMSYVMLQLGLALGPLLVGLSIIPAVSFLFDGWLRFMIAASLQQLVAWFVAVLITKGVVPTLVSFTTRSTAGRRRISTSRPMKLR